MTYFGISMPVNDVLEGINMIEQRMLSYVDPNLSDDQIKHKLAYDSFNDFAFSKPLNLSGILDDCIKYNVIPLINLCITEGKWKDHPRISPSECAKIAGLLRDYLKSRGFKKDTAYIGLFNEPNTQVGLTSKEVCDYTNPVHDKVGLDFDVVYGNDEYGNLDWNYLGKNCRAMVMGIHHLSSLGSWKDPRKYFNHIKDCKNIANLYGKKLIGTECGSWFKDYCKEGHQINLDIMSECKKYDYLGCLIVLPDINEQSKKEWKLLGYRVWDKNFAKQVGGCSDKFDEFMEYIKDNGTVPDMEDDMKLKPVYKNGMKNEIGIKFIQMILNEDMKPVPLLKVDGWWGDKTDAIVLDFQEKYNLAQYGGAIGPNTMQFMIKKYPSIWDVFDYLYRIGLL